MASLTEAPRTHVLVAARRGEAWALAELYQAHGPAVFRLAYRLTRTREDAEDVVHDMFVGLPEMLQRYEERGALQSWLKRVTVRMSLMRLRQSNRRREITMDDLAEQAAPEKHAHAGLQEAVDALPDNLRSVLVLKEIEGYSHSEVASLLGISAGTSRVRLLRAMRRLRQILKEDR